MKRNLLLLFCLLSLFTQADSGDTYHVKKVVSAPVIDGQLTEWSDVTEVNFTVHTDGSTGSTSGTAQVVWDDDAIYFAFSISDTDVKSNYTDQDDNLFNNDDLVEIFLDFDGDQKNYLELGVSAANVNYDMTACPAVSCGFWVGNSTWDISGLETAVIVNGTINNSLDVDEGYIIEVKIPFSGLTSAPEANFETPMAGTEWKGNLYTIDYSTGALIDAANDYLSWSTLGSFGFHQPSEFALFVFDEIGALIEEQNELFDIVFKGANKWQILSRNETTVKLYDLTGKEVFTQTYNDIGLLNFSSFHSGIYLLAIEGNGIKKTEKLIVK